MEESLSKFMAEFVKRHEENSNLIKEIRASMEAAIRNQGASIKALEIQNGQMSNVLQERGFGNLPSSTKRLFPFPSCLYDDCCDEEDGSYGLKNLDAYSIRTTLLDDALPTKEKDPGSFTLPCIINNLCFKKSLADLGVSVSVMPFSTYTKLELGELAPSKLIVELGDRTVKCPKGIAENVLVRIDKFVYPVDFVVLDMPEDIKTHLILGRPFLSTAHAKIDVFKRKITLKVENDKLDLEARLMGEALILNRSLDPLYGDYIELNDLNESLEHRRNQVADLEPNIKEGEVVDEPMMDIVKTRYDNEIVDGLNEYPSYCDFDRKIHIDCAFNLQFTFMVGYKHVNVNFFPLLSINVMSKNFYNSIMKDKVEYKAFMNVPIFDGNFFIVTDFAVIEDMDSYRDEGMGDIIVGRVIEDMDSYRDEGMGDIIVGRPFYKEACVKASRFDGMITICKGNDSVTYQMVRSQPRFKHLTNAQCNKMRPLLKVSAQDELKGISHPYQKLKGFYKEVLNLGVEYIKNEKFEEWLTRGHVSVHEME
ncbi:ribonuclease H-like domain, reverse transcriptase, RNA-dependent DNA polymerase [Tanacetum coccineum]